MQSLMGSVLRWLARHFVSFLIIVAILMAGNFILKEVREFKSQGDALSTFKDSQEALASYIETQKRQLLERAAGLAKDTQSALNARLTQLDGAIKQKKSEQRSPLLRKLAFVGGDGLLDDLKRDAEIALLEQEREYLAYLHSASLAKAGLIACRDELEQGRQKHLAAYRAVGANNAAQARLVRENPFASKFNPLSSEYRRLRELAEQRGALLAGNQAAHEDYERQRKVCAAMQKIDDARQLAFPQERIDAALAAVVTPAQERLAELDALYRANWLAKFSAPLIAPLIDVLPTALGVLLSLILLPVAIKTFFYFVVAPLASRRPAICLLPGVVGVIDGGLQHRKISQVSLPISLNDVEELLVYPEHLQSSSRHGEKDTKLLLDWAYSLTSLASGMMALTRIRASVAESYVISAAKDDPFDEIAILSIPDGGAVVFQPHGLVGVVQRRDCPIRISSHWRLGSLNAWLTLQLRFLVFHGPARLIVKGGRGVVLEQAGSGRSIDQAATLGFSANLAYSTTRCETFGAYLLGKQALFNDHFAGGPGFYAYEEMPRFGKKGGVTGRWWESFVDALLKAVGI